MRAFDKAVRRKPLAVAADAVLCKLNAAQRGAEARSEWGTWGGDVEVSGLAGNLTARTSGGDIELRELSGDVNVKTSGGHITLENARGRVDAHTSGGDVTAALARGNGQGGEIETSGGDIKVRVDPAVRLTLDTSTSSGEVVSNLPLKITGEISPSRLHATLGSGGETLRVHTNGGSVRISAL